MKPSKPKAEARARPAALRLLARREHSVTELRHKLARVGFPAEEVETVLQELLAERLLDNGRFAEAYVRSHVARGAGPVRIAHGLAEHGLSRSDVETHLAPFNDRWGPLASRARRKRFGPDVPANMKDRARQTRFLHYRGFTADQIRRACDGEHDDCDDVG